MCEGGAATQRLPQGVEGGWRGKSGGRRGGRSSQTCHDTPALGIRFICAHIAYSYWSLMAENVLIRVIVVENCEARALVLVFFPFEGGHLGRGEVEV